jgi:hypothetical protein
LHAPLQTKECIIRESDPWYTEEINAAKRNRRKAEKKWRKDKTQINKDILNAKSNKVNFLILQAKKHYISSEIEKTTGDQKRLYKLCNKLLYRKQVSPLPSHSSDNKLAEHMSDYFENKIFTIRRDIELIKDSLNADPHRYDTPAFKTPLTSFKPTSQDELKTIIMSSSTTTCNLDPVPSSLVKECLPTLLPILTDITNSSLASGTMPEQLKKAHIRPLLKKADKDHEDLKNYRPVSNLSFLSKVIERVVAKRLNHHKDVNNLSQVNQSAFKRNHSVETALMKVQNDLLQAVDRGKCAILVLLDLSAAFDTVDHAILKKRLKDRFGIRGMALTWLTSYLSNRKHAVLIGDSTSTEKSHNYDVPQGSVLGPGLYEDYTCPLSDIVNFFQSVKNHLYADDNQIYILFDPNVEGDAERAKSILIACIKEIRSFMFSNYLKLNDDKTEVLLIGTKHNLKPFLNFDMQIGTEIVQRSPHARNIGVTFDSEMNMQKHIQNTAKAAWFHLWNISKIRKYLNQDATKSLIQALVISKLDFCNSLLYALPDSHLKPLKSIQNAAV